MRTSSETGAGRVGSIIWLAILVAAGYAAWHVLPAYIDNLAFKDKLQEIARSPRGVTTDEKVLDMIQREVRERQLTGYIQVRNACRIATRETSRTIQCVYDREVEPLPGWKQVLHFDDTVEGPLLY
jgi:hypothetical protein